MYIGIYVFMFAYQFAFLHAMYAQKYTLSIYNLCIHIVYVRTRNAYVYIHLCIIGCVYIYIFTYMYYNYIHHILQVYTPWNSYLLNIPVHSGILPSCFFGFKCFVSPWVQIRQRHFSPYLLLHRKLSPFPVGSKTMKPHRHVNEGITVVYGRNSTKNTVNKQLCQMVVSAHSSTTVDNIRIQQDRMVCA